jgi:ORMDL family
VTAFQCSYLMFHWATGIPFGSELHGGAYDDLTLWEQIDGGAQNTPSRKWLFSVPVGLYVSRPFLTIPQHESLTRPTLPKLIASCFRHTTRITTHGCSPSIFQLSSSPLYPSCPSYVECTLARYCLDAKLTAAWLNRPIANACVFFRITLLVLGV